MKPFVHLHNHTAYSLLDGAGRVEDEVKRAADLGMPALAITDHGVMYGAVHFFKECKKYNIKPIIGCEVYVARRTRFDREPGRDDAPYHLILLVENEKGYRNLCKLVSYASIEGFYYRPRVDKELLKKYHEGLIALSACLSGEVPRLILADEIEAAREAALWYQQIFGKENFYLEVQNHGIKEQQYVNPILAEFSRTLHIPMVATNDNHYVKREDAEVQDIMLCIQTGKTFHDPTRMRFDNDSFYMKSYDEMAEALPDYLDALDNTVKIAERCQFEFDFSKNYMPQFETPNGESLEEYLHQQCEIGLMKRYIQPTLEQRERMKYELSVIHNMGFDAYFLIVWDFIRFARENGIYVGPGRGSAAGSLVSYVLGITDIDPIKYDLLFERFLNPERVNMPDIDIDFCYERRGEVIDYVAARYGVEHVSQIITFGTMKARGAIRDVGRVMNIPIPIVNKVCKLIPNEINMTIDKALEVSPELNTLIDQDEAIRELINMGRRLEGLPRNAGTHAAGVVISNKAMDHYLPLQRTNDGVIITQFAKEDVESIGLLKMDFLGLRTLTVINHTIEDVRQRYGIEIDFNQIDDNDSATFEMMSRGETLGVFQLESSGLRTVIKELKPSCLEDVIALVALYRPGPLNSGMVDDFIKRKHGESEIEYLHPILEPILKTTYGVILYQEQVMQIASEMAKFTLGEADMLRRAMGKKKPEIIESFKTQFIQGAVNNGVFEEIAMRIFWLIDKFSGYGFNKSHSAAYGLLAFETAWLKCHYPREFMAQVLNSVMDNPDKITFYINECRTLGIDILPPDVNESGYGFTVTKDGIRFGLGAVRGIGDHPVSAIIEARESGIFTDFQDFCERVDLSRGINKRVLEALIGCGAFQFTGCHKKQLMNIVDECILQAQSLQKARNSNQMSFFDMLSEDDYQNAVQINIPDVPEYSSAENLKLERELLGIYVSGHPLDEVRDLMQKINLLECTEINEDLDGQRVRMGGLITNIRFQTTKSGGLMAYAMLEDLTGRLELLIFPKSLPELRPYLEEDHLLLVNGRLSALEEEPKLFVESLSFLRKDQKESGFNRLRKASDEEASMVLYLKISGVVDKNKLLSLIRQFPGQLPVYCYDVETRKMTRLHDSYRIANIPEAMAELESFLGVENISLKRK